MVTNLNKETARPSPIAVIRAITVSMVVFYTAVVVMASLIWLQQFAAVTACGLGLAAGFWRYRSDNSWRNAICVMGILSLCTGVVLQIAAA